MQILKEGHKSKAICFSCKKLRNTTLKTRNVPFSDGYGEIEKLLVYVCNHCNSVISSPQQSTSQIKLALQKRREAIGMGQSIESLHQNALKLIEGIKQIEVEKITGVKQSQISRIKKGFQNRDKEAVLKIVEKLSKKSLIGPFYHLSS